MPALFTRTFNLLLGGQFLQNLGFATLPLVPLYLAFLGASRTDIGIVMAAGGIGGVLFRPAIGWALDALGRRIVLYAATALTAATVAWLALIDTVGPALYANRILFGVGMGGAATAWFTIAADVIPPSRRTEGIALFGVAGLAGLVLSPIAGELGMTGGELRLLLPIVAIIIALSILPVLAIRTSSDAPKPSPIVLRDLLRALVAPRLAPVWLATFIFAALFAVFLFFGSVAAEARGVDRPTHLWFTYAAGAIFVRILGSRLPDRVGPANLVAPSLGVYVLALLFAATADTTGGFLIAGLLAGLGHGYFFPCAATLAMNRMPEKMRGSSIAAFTALLELSGFIAAPVFGYIADVRGDEVMFLTASLFGYISLAVWAVFEHLRVKA